ncbi:hypothetical protein KEM54_005436 [Ascosphaera aggregata]|nr:hypothetical protein KEM54_005436 [Ascosphaera aggregata]
MNLYFWKSAPKEPTTAPEPIQSPPQPQPQTISPQEKPAPTSLKDRLTNSQKLIIGGAAFLGMSVLVTRRAFARQRIAVMPPFYTTSVYHKPPVNSAKDALEAFNVATINVMSVGMLALGLGMYATGINTIEDARRVVRGGMGTNGVARTDEEVEEELQEWLAGVIMRKSKKDEMKREQVSKGESS